MSILKEKLCASKFVNILNFSEAYACVCMILYMHVHVCVMGKKFKDYLMYFILVLIPFNELQKKIM